MNNRNAFGSIGMAVLAACGSTKTITSKATQTVTTPAECEVLSDAQVERVPSEITTDTRFAAGKTYRLESHTFVRNGATLTIDAGVTVVGASGSSLVVSAGSKIDAQGTASQPVTFTSCRPVGQRKPGDWGGVVLLGRAPINVVDANNNPTTENVEGFDPTENRVNYGGSDSAHNCGSIRYARIQYAGFPIQADKEINGLTVAGCGHTTTLDFIQVHLGKDDGVEFFGGTANIKHLIVSQADDDAIDWDFGWNGKAQFVIVQQNPAFGDNAIEADNNEDGNDLLPRSSPTLFNLSLIGSNKQKGTGQAQQAMVLRRGTAGTIANAIVANFSDFAVDVRDASTVAQANSGALSIHHSLFFGSGNQMGWVDTKDNDAGFSEETFFQGSGLSNLHQQDPQLQDPFSLLAPNWKTAPGSVARVSANAAVPPSDGFFDTTATFIGAIGESDWTAGWTEYPAN